MRLKWSRFQESTFPGDGSYRLSGFFFTDPRNVEYLYATMADNGASETTFLMYKSIRAIRILVELEVGQSIGISDFKVQRTHRVIPAQAISSNIWTAEADRMMDYDNQTYWMARPDTIAHRIDVDLGAVYWIDSVEVHFFFVPETFFVRVTETLENPTWVEIGSMFDASRWSVYVARRLARARYVQIEVVSPFEDLDEVIGTAIRDIAVLVDQNLARYQTAVADSVWDYPPANVVDGRDDTPFISEFDTEQGTIVVDLQSVVNIAGVQVKWLHRPQSFTFAYSLDNVTYNMVAEEKNNIEHALIMDPTTFHFQARFIRVEVKAALPVDWMFDPDYWGDQGRRRPVVAISEIVLIEHTGGGGVFGIQNPDGSQWDTITFGQRQPGQWASSSEDDNRTADVFGEVGAAGEKVQIVATYRGNEVQVYRNGEAFGSSYIAGPGPVWRPGSRVIFGVRSTAWAVPGATDPNSTDYINSTKHGQTHSAFFHGTIHMATLIHRALLPEEVRGLYEHYNGGRERGCHCVNACPMGSNPKYPGTPIPCSGTGVCIRNETGDHFSTGHCQCLPGYSGDSCQVHCSSVSTGCCEDDDDCVAGRVCNKATQICDLR
mmetsp:Transcript_122559/g.280921  ORF Transcript_122559/g.280921 Transcript_122559/m.280921 type:complete len:604 (+) Transcript_122559:565-2376(+)